MFLVYVEIQMFFTEYSKIYQSKILRQILHYCGKIGILPFGSTPDGLDDEAPIYVQT
jgi:hypothetical protein